MPWTRSSTTSPSRPPTPIGRALPVVAHATMLNSHASSRKYPVAEPQDRVAGQTHPRSTRIGGGVTFQYAVPSRFAPTPRSRRHPPAVPRMSPAPSRSSSTAPWRKNTAKGSCRRRFSRWPKRSRGASLRRGCSARMSPPTGCVCPTRGSEPISRCFATAIPVPETASTT